MVQQIPQRPLPGNEPKKKPWLLPLLLLLGIAIYFSLPPFLEQGPNGSYVLSKKRQKDLEQKPLRSEQVEVYRLIAGTSGNYPCLKCGNGATRIFLNNSEVWKYGISRNGRKRYKENFYSTNRLIYQPITVTDILSAEQLELELIIAYPLLPECQKRMKLHKIFLKRPPGSAVDK